MSKETYKPKIYRYRFSEKENKLFNQIANEKTRKLSMSIYQYINNYISEKTGFLDMSLDRLYERYSQNKKRKKEKCISISYFKDIANKILEIGLLMVKRKGRLKFYGKKDLKEENENLKEENRRLKEELEKVKPGNGYIKQTGEEIADNKKLDELNLVEANRDTVIDAACKLMNEVKIINGSTPYMQVIESLHKAMDKKPIHIMGMIKYIKKTIQDKVYNQTQFKEKLIKERSINKKAIYNGFNNFEGRQHSLGYYEKLEAKLLGY